MLSCHFEIFIISVKLIIIYCFANGRGINIVECWTNIFINYNTVKYYINVLYIYFVETKRGNRKFIKLNK